MKTQQQERDRILNNIKKGAEEIIRDREERRLTEELTDFIDELEDCPMRHGIPISRYLLG